VYKVLVVSVAHVPVWAANLQVAFGVLAANIQADLAQIPILMVNSNAGNHGPLCNPTQAANGWAPYLANPNLRTWDKLLLFTSESTLFSHI